VEAWPGKGPEKVAAEPPVRRLREEPEGRPGTARYSRKSACTGEGPAAAGRAPLGWPPEAAGPFGRSRPRSRN